MSRKTDKAENPTGKPVRGRKADAAKRGTDAASRNPGAPFVAERQEIARRLARMGAKALNIPDAELCPEVPAAALYVSRNLALLADVPGEGTTAKDLRALLDPNNGAVVALARWLTSYPLALREGAERAADDTTIVRLASLEALRAFLARCAQSFPAVARSAAVAELAVAKCVECIESGGSGAVAVRDLVPAVYQQAGAMWVDLAPEEANGGEDAATLRRQRGQALGVLGDVQELLGAAEENKRLRRRLEEATESIAALQRHAATAGAPTSGNLAAINEKLEVLLSQGANGGANGAPKTNRKRKPPMEIDIPPTSIKVTLAQYDQYCEECAFAGKKATKEDFMENYANQKFVDAKGNLVAGPNGDFMSVADMVGSVEALRALINRRKAAKCNRRRRQRHKR